LLIKNPKWNVMQRLLWKLQVLYCTHTSYIIHHNTSYITHRTSHVTHHTSHITHHTSHIKCGCAFVSLNVFQWILTHIHAHERTQTHTHTCMHAHTHTQYTQTHTESAAPLPQDFSGLVNWLCTSPARYVLNEYDNNNNNNNNINNNNNNNNVMIRYEKFHGRLTWVFGKLYRRSQALLTSCMCVCVCMCLCVCVCMYVCVYVCPHFLTEKNCFNCI